MTGESKRQIEHMLPLGFAFLLRYLTVTQAVICCFGALVYGLFISPRVNKAGVREQERARGFSMGKAMYALSILLLILIFQTRMHIAAGAWAVLSLGDATSNLAGRAWGVKKLPWSRQKTWIGAWAFFLSSWTGSLVLVYWTAGGQGLPHPGLVIAACGAASLAAALVETLPIPLDDNLTSPLAAAAVMAAVL